MNFYFNLIITRSGEAIEQLEISLQDFYGANRIKKLNDKVASTS